MKQFLIQAYDYTDAQALDRRMATRPFHLEIAKKLKESGNFVMGGAMLNADDKMIGSVMVLQFETQAEFDEYYANEPYIKQKVWEKIEVKPFRVANV